MSVHKQKGKLAAYLTYLSPFQKYKIKNSYSEEICDGLGSLCRASTQGSTLPLPCRRFVGFCLAESLLDFFFSFSCVTWFKRKCYLSLSTFLPRLDFESTLEQVLLLFEDSTDEIITQSEFESRTSRSPFHRDCCSHCYFPWPALLFHHSSWDTACKIQVLSSFFL